MFNWIKKLSKAKLSFADDASTRQTRVVKRIVPTSQRVQEEEEAASANSPVVENTPPRQSENVSPTFTLTPNLPKAAPAISLTQEAEAPAPRIPAPISLAPRSKEPEPAEPVAPTAEAPRKKLSLNLPGAPDTTAAPGVSATREIILKVSDFIAKIPPHFVDEKAASADLEVRFNAADLYSDMTKGRATVPLSVIAESVPKLFKRALSAEEDVEIQLPLSKIVAQMSDLLTRKDQEEPEKFVEVETPFLKAAKRDQEIHGVSGAVSVSEPSQPPTPAPAPSPAARPKPISLETAPAEPARAATGAAKPGPKTTNRRVTVRIRPLIQAMPIQQREKVMNAISENSEVDLPLDEIENQLSSGRVSISLDSFSKALDPATRKVFNENFQGKDVPISLSEVVKNLPKDTLQMRGDQHEQEVDPTEFETPFNTTPDTIAQRPAEPPPLSAAIPRPSSPHRPKPLVTPAIPNYATRKLNSALSKFPSPMHAALNTHDALDAKKVVKLASALPGVASLTIITSDGLGLAGNLPHFMNPEGFSAMAPQLHRKMASHAEEMKLGELRHLSLSTETHTITIFTGNSMTIAVLHQNQSDLGHGVKEKFIAIVEGLAAQYGDQKTE